MDFKDTDTVNDSDAKTNVKSRKVNPSIVLGTRCESKHKGTIVIGRDLKSVEDNETVLGSVSRVIRIKENGVILSNGVVVPVDEILVKELIGVMKDLAIILDNA